MGIKLFLFLLINYLAFSALRCGRLPVYPDAAVYQCFTWSDCLTDLHNPVTEQHDTILPGFWLSVTTIKELWVTAGINGFTYFPRPVGVTPLTSILRAATEKFLMEKPNNTFLPDLEIESRSPRSTVALATTRPTGQFLVVIISFTKPWERILHTSCTFCTGAAMVRHGTQALAQYLSLPSTGARCQPPLARD